MLKRTLFVLPVVLLLAVACTSGGEEQTAREAEETPSASPTAVATATEGPSEAAAPLAGVMNPLAFLGGSFLGEGAAPSPSGLEVDPDLEGSLLRDEDLPAGYSSFGPLGMSFTLSGEDLGLDEPGEFTVKLAMAYFFEGDIESGDIGAMVASMVMVLPEETLDEVIASFEELDEEALRAGLGEASQMAGLEFKDARILDASGLGEGGAGMHMVMDLGAMGLGEIPGGELFGGDFAFDVYTFVRGGKALMLMTMWPGGELSTVDSRSLAELMDRRAAEAF